MMLAYSPARDAPDLRQDEHDIVLSLQPGSFSERAADKRKKKRGAVNCHTPVILSSLIEMYHRTAN